MKKQYYRVTKNGIVIGEYDAIETAFTLAESIERMPLSWKSLSDDSYFAFGKTVRDARTEYEVTLAVRGRKS